MNRKTMLVIAGFGTLVLAGCDEMSPFAGNLGNAIWTLSIFLIVLAVLRKFAWGPILAGLQRREQFIHESLSSAKRDREAAEARLQEHEQRLLAAREEASKIVEEGRRDGESVKRKIEEDARLAGDEMIERARREIGVARDTAMRDLYERSADLATNVAGTILRRQISGEDHAQLVREALDELKQKKG